MFLACRAQLGVVGRVDVRQHPIEPCRARPRAKVRIQEDEDRVVLELEHPLETYALG